MQRSSIKRVAILFSVTLLFTACEYGYIIPEPTVVTPQKKDFTTDILPIFVEQGCSAEKCHQPLGPEAPDFTPDYVYDSLLAYVDTVVPENSILYVTLEEGGLYHQGRTTPQQRADILQWISEGASGASTNNTDLVSFKDEVLPIFDGAGCSVSGCHKPEGGINPDFSPANAYSSLTGFIDTDNPGQSALYIQLTTASSHLGFTNSSEEALILQWITEGGLNN